ncbi:hypothetical protein GCM10023189_56020 [Nibrella saemangeumensis]|uniref:Uncharacterized protein n=1 Tax=Nibrella saemangeumensis TaxID=1084526 RepID=A0ABP8NQ77_9BACT
MKSCQLLLLSICLIGTTTFSNGQSGPDAQTVIGLKQYIANVGKTSGEPGERYIRGCLYAITDSTLTLVSPVGLKKDLMAGKPLDLTVIPLSNIEHVSITGRGKAGTGIGMGIGLGSLIGLVASAGSSSSGGINFTPMSGAMPVVYLGGLGALLGTIIGVSPNAVVYRLSTKENWKRLDKYTIVTQLTKIPRGATVIYESQRTGGL